MAKRSRAKRPQRTEARAIEKTSSETKLVAGIAVGLLLSVFIVYGQVAHHDFINVDDTVYVPQNHHVTSGLSAENIRWAFTSFHAAYWIPLTWISYMADVEMFGIDPGKILLTNIVLHALNTLLLFLALRRATAATWRSGVVAALFALHPLHVESVAWVTERKDVLSTFFFLVMLLAYIAFVEKRTAARYALIMVSFACGLMAKPMVITAPFVLLLFDWWPLRRFPSVNLKALLIEKLPLLVMIIPAAMVTLKAQKPAIAAVPIMQRLGNAAVSYVTYLVKAVWPSGLAVIYPLKNVSAATAAAAVVCFIGITAVALFCARRFPWVTTGWFWYAGTLVPVIGIVQAGKQSMADRFTYIPLIGIFIAIVWLVAEFAPVRKFAPAAAAAVLIACAAASYVQAGYWKDSITLERHALAVTADNDVAHVYLGSALFTHGDRDAAEQEFRKAIAVNPLNEEAYRDLARLKLATHPEEAVPLLQKASSLKPNDYETQAMLAAAQGDRERAVTLYQRALAEQDDTPDLRNDFAAVLAMTGHDEQALEQYNEALRMMPDHYNARMNIGALLSRMGRDADAIEQFQAAVRARPEASEPHVYLALAYGNRGQVAAAITEVQSAISVDPAGSNKEFTNAVRMPFKESNLRDYLAFLQQKARS
jgi:tetratricopeptide (TPR) repeat protein